LCIAGVLLEGLHIPDDTLHWFLNPDAGEIAGWVPEGNAWVRTYLSFWGDRKPRFSGFSGLARLLRDMEWTGTGREFFSRTRSAGPLATFDAADRWVEYPYKNGVALLGDSAASNDPTWGQGLSIALRSARTLRDALMARLDWDQAGNDYAREFRRWYTNIRRMTGWLRELYMETGAAADVRRGQVFSLKKRDPSRYPDLLFSGPDFPLDSESRARFFGEDLWGRVSVQAA
ncbi:MAG: FAD-dependent oxidoreductase, partial [Terriglobales bacterium]